MLLTAPKECQPRRKATGWGQLRCLEAKAHSTEKIKMLAASSNKAGSFLPPCLVDSFPGSRLWLCICSLTFKSQRSLRRICKLWCDLWPRCLILRFPRCHKDSWTWGANSSSTGFTTRDRERSGDPSLTILGTEIQNKLSRHQQQMQVHRCLLITKPHSSWDLNSLLYAKQQREWKWRKLAITQFYFPPSPFAFHQIALSSHTKVACEL